MGWLIEKERSSFCLVATEIMPMSLIGKRALITGASRGIGAACALKLAQAGTWCACADLSDANETVARIEAEHGKAMGMICDVSDEASVMGLAADLKRKIGRIDLLVHCAGIIHEKALLETSAADFDRVININLRGSFLIGRESLRMMQGHRGRIIMIASDLSYAGRETFSPYVASKHGVMGLVRSWAKEFAPDITVNAICPGPIDTAMLDADNMTPAWREKELDIPLRRFGQPDEIAELAVFLAGKGGDYITGQGLGINGGSVMP